MYVSLEKIETQKSLYCIMQIITNVKEFQMAIVPHIQRVRTQLEALLVHVMMDTWVIHGDALVSCNLF